MVNESWPDEVKEEVQELVSLLTRSLHSKFSPWVQEEDVRQHLYELAWKRRGKLTEYLTQEDKKGGWAAASAALSRSGERYCRKTKADRVGYRVSDEFFYDKTLVSEMIRFLHTGVIERKEDESGGRRPRSLAEGGNIDAMMADVSAAIQSLSPEDATLITAYYGLESDSKEIATDLGVSRQAVESKADRILGRLVRFLGGSSPWS